MMIKRIRIIALDMAQKSAMSKVGLGAALGAAAAAAATGLYIYGKTHPAAAKKAKAWSLKAKAEMLEKLEKMQDVSEVAYNAAADAVTAKYAKLKDVGDDQAQALNAELKRYFRAIKREMNAGGKKKTAKKTAKKAPAKKKAAKKASK